MPRGGSLPTETWLRRHWAIVGLLWLHFIAIAIFAITRGNGLLHSVTEASVIAVFALGAGAKVLGPRWREVIATVGLLTSSAILVHLSGGSIEMHFHFFVMVGVITLYENWTPFLVAIAYVVLHHGVVGSIDPEQVFNHPEGIAAPWKWSLVHGFFIMLASTVGLIAWRMREDFRQQIDDLHLKRLQLSEKRYEGLVEDLPGIVYIAPIRDSPWTYVSHQIEDILGLGPKEATSKSWWVNHLHPDDREAVLREEQRILESGEPFSLVYRIIARDGRVVWIHDRATVIKHAAGPPSLQGVMFDITDLKQAEQALKEKEEQLRHSQKMEAIGQLAGGVAHDFNNILSIIMNYADFLQQDFGEGDPRWEDLQEIRNAGQRASSLVEQLLVFSRKQGGRPTIVNVNDIIYGLQKLLKRTIREDIFLTTELATRVDPVKIDPVQMEQILVNLVVNSKDAMPSGGDIIIQSSAVNIDDAAAVLHSGLRPGRYVRLTVKDTGLGMTEEVKARVFEPFFTTKPVGKGTGLGLAMVYGLVAEAGGGVEIESTNGVGTTVSVYLPADSETAVEEEEESPAAAAIGRGERILVVEDEPAVRSVVERILAGNGYSVVAASSGEEALHVLQDTSVDLVLTDMVMPGMSGKELVEHLKPLLPQARYCFMSGYTHDFVPPAEGGWDPELLLRKPFSAQELLSKMRAMLDAQPKRSDDTAITRA